MKRLLTAAVLGLAAPVLLPMAAAQADPGTCRDSDAVLTPVVGEGPQAKKDRNGNGWICVVSGFRNNGDFFSKFSDDQL